MRITAASISVFIYAVSSVSVTEIDESSSTHVVCVDDKTSTATTTVTSTKSDEVNGNQKQTAGSSRPSILQCRFDYFRWWPNQAVHTFFKYFLRNSYPFASTQNRCIRIEGQHGKELQVYHGSSNDGSTCSAEEVYYELLEPLHLELGIGNVQHIEDFAYSPVAVRTAIIENDNEHILLTQQQRPNGNSLEESPAPPRRGWWQWWIPWRILRDRTSSTKFFNDSKYTMNDEAFAGGSHGEVWRGRRKCVRVNDNCSEESLIFKRLKVERGFRTLEAGLREIHFGNIFRQLSYDDESQGLFTQYIEHFFGNNGELWIVFMDHGLSLRSFLYTPVDAPGGFVVFQQSWLWTLMRISLHAKQPLETTSKNNDDASQQDNAIEACQASQVEPTVSANQKSGKILIRTFLKQILESVKVLHENGIVHRDIKPSNIICKSNIDMDKLQSIFMETPQVHCVLGDFSSAYDDYTSRNVYTRGPSGLEQTNEYAPPEAIFGDAYNETSGVGITTSFDSWSIGIVALEILLGTPNVFSVDQRTRMVLSYKMRKKGASDNEIERAIYLAALSQFCIYNPMDLNQRDWPLRDGDPLHQSAMTKQTCTMTDFHRALRARDPLGWGFELSDALLHLIWKLLEWDPMARMTAADALNHPYFTQQYTTAGDKSDPTPGDHNALESQMLDPRMDFNISDSISEFVCPKCGRIFSDWKSCHTHTNSRKHAKFCVYDRSTLPTCLNSHTMLPAHSYSGYCDIQGRRRTIEDFHAIHLLPNRQFYGIFDGHSGNFASKYAASFLYDEVSARLGNWTSSPNHDVTNKEWYDMVEDRVTEAFSAVHEKFVAAVTTRVPPTLMDQSGTTATALLVTNHTIVVMSLGDSRAVLSARRQKLSSDTGSTDSWELVAKQLTKDHVAADQEERELVESRGGHILSTNGMDRVMGSLIVTRSIGDPNLARYLSRIPHVISMSKEDVLNSCGIVDSKQLCFFILASDGLWDTVGNQEAIDMVEVVVNEYVLKSTGSNSTNNSQIGPFWYETAALQQAAEALTHEAYVRGSTDNIGVCIVAIS